jgi:hypothetical protein
MSAAPCPPLDDAQLERLIYLVCQFVDQWGRRPTPFELKRMMAFLDRVPE